MTGSLGGHLDLTPLPLPHFGYNQTRTIGAPVFAADGTVALGVFILGFRDALTAEQVPDVAERLMKASGAITESIHGHGPR